MMTAMELIEIAESAAPPAASECPYSSVELPARDGWRVVFFYDCGDLDYIEHFISPLGEVIDFWQWPDSSERNLLIAWNGMPR